MKDPIIAVAALAALAVVLFVVVEAARMTADWFSSRRTAEGFAEAYWRRKGIDAKLPKWPPVALLAVLSLSACSLQPRVDRASKSMIREQALTAVKVRADYVSGVAALGDLQIKSRVNRLSAQIVAAERFVGEDIDGDGRVGE